MYNFSKKYIKEFFGNTSFLVKNPLASEKIHVSLTKYIPVAINELFFHSFTYLFMYPFIKLLLGS